MARGSKRWLWNHIFFIIWVYSCGALGKREVEPPIEARLREFLMELSEWPVRPVRNYSNELVVLIRFRLSKVVELSMKEQMLTLKTVIELEWTHSKLQWDPNIFGGISQIPFPVANLWIPDLEFYNGYGELSLNGETVTVHHNGLIQFRSQNVLTNYCEIVVIYYPFDIQFCQLIFGAWTYDSSRLRYSFMDLPEVDRSCIKNSTLPIGMNLQDYYPSNEWDLVSIPGKIHVIIYAHTPDPYIRISIDITLRRRWKFYIVNLILPLMILSYLTLLVFYLPADSGEKIPLCMSLLTSQIMFLVLMIENIPVTSLAVPLLGKFIIFNLSLLFLSVFGTTLVLNVHFRSPFTHDLPQWVRNLRTSRVIRKILWLDQWECLNLKKVKPVKFKGYDLAALCASGLQELSCKSDKDLHIQRTFQNIQTIQRFIQNNKELNEERENWKFAGAVIDRIFLVIFNILFIVVVAILLYDAPALYDRREPVQ